MLNETIDKILFDYSLVMTHTELREKAIAEILSALASTPDEGLRELVAAYLQFEEQKKMPPSWSDVQKKHQLGRAAAILSLVQPVITALRAKLAEAEKRMGDCWKCEVEIRDEIIVEASVEELINIIQEWDAHASVKQAKQLLSLISPIFAARAEKVKRNALGEALLKCDLEAEKEIQQAVERGRRMAFAEIARTLDIHENGLGFVEISNHVPFKDFNRGESLEVK